MKFLIYRKLNKNKVICLKCNAEYEEGTNFCNVCGTKLIINEKVKMICPNCNLEYKEGTNFCNDCGTKLIKKE
jgi:rRNA maturation endonuclease Nob1